MNIQEMNSMEANLLRKDLQRTVSLCKALIDNYGTITDIISKIALERLGEAAYLWNELDYPVQKLLYIAPSKGGAFNTQERAIIKSFWIISVSDYEGRN